MYQQPHGEHRASPCYGRGESCELGTAADTRIADPPNCHARLRTSLASILLPSVLSFHRLRLPFRIFRYGWSSFVAVAVVCCCVDGIMAWWIMDWRGSAPRNGPEKKRFGGYFGFIQIGNVKFAMFLEWRHRKVLLTFFARYSAQFIIVGSHLKNDIFFSLRWIHYPSVGM